MEQFFTAVRRTHFNRVLASASRIALGVVGAVAIPAIVVLTGGLLSNADTATCTDASKPGSQASILIASAHRFAADAARRRAELEAREAARQARMDMAAQDLLNHD